MVSGVVLALLRGVVSRIHLRAAVGTKIQNKPYHLGIIIYLAAFSILECIVHMIHTGRIFFLAPDILFSSSFIGGKLHLDWRRCE